MAEHTAEKVPTLQQAVADVLASWGVRSSHGEWTDREAQMHAAREVLRLLPPEPDNHHNAALCPYCQPAYVADPCQACVADAFAIAGTLAGHTCDLRISSPGQRRAGDGT